MPVTPLSTLTTLFASATDYLGESVTVSVHMRQAATLAATEAAPDPLIAAALLHDIGHLAETHAAGLSGAHLMSGIDAHHGDTGATWLGQWFGPEVTEPIRLHVQAKRYLCATDPTYWLTLSTASQYTLSVQGGPMTAGEATAFEQLPHAEDAVQVRRWDDRAKDPGVTPLPFIAFIPLLTSLTI